MAEFQLYTSGMTFDMPWSVRRPKYDGQPTVSKRTLSNQVYMYWPNGVPCTPINLWLQLITLQSTGESAVTFAIHMTHFIRYCFDQSTQLLEIDDKFLCDFAKALEQEKKLKYAALSDKRNPNHIGYTIRRVLDFLIWYQMNLRLSAQPKLIGVLGTGAQVTIEWKTGSRGQPVLHHPAIPTKRPPVGDKKPMPDDFIGKLLESIDALRIQSPDEPSSQANRKKQDLIAKSLYLYGRRMITVKLTKLTGLRPDELNSIPLHLNLNPVEKRLLFIPTLKTRESSPPIREFPLSLEDAIDVSTYLQDRESFLQHFNREAMSTGAFLLGQNGAPIETRSLARDFRRICEHAGLRNVQVCLSMFRHRFITTQIAYEIRLELGRALAQKDLWLEAVQRRILGKVAKLTGHRDPMSLKHYFNEAYAQAVSRSQDTTPTQKSKLVAKMEGSIERLSRHPEINHNPELLREIAMMEKHLRDLKASGSDGKD
ncbi:hypothetical protein A8L59_17975 [Pseudomonas koreensis]|uniref:Tyr recombinase domain-containing protein n=1 Tax=Pseudomonas koreensis TaxID=198620 RepID=A0AAC9FY84_9PSED|nr:tyrosine-type recombinase/integrase [Pseudomonas koreensis]ANH99217.1 hypothetical protein A8L59_17975 [Pseudomonas koreensis]